MDKPKELSVTLNVAEGNIATLLLGDALPLQQPRKILIEGNINNPREWFEKRADATKENSYVVVRSDNDSASIDLIINDKDFYATEISGELVQDENLKSFHINGNQRWSIPELVKFLRIRKHFFKTVDSWKSLLDELQSFKAKIDVDIEKASTTGGNKKELLEVKVNQNLPKEFILNVPLFKGQIPLSFRVEVGAEYTDSAVKIFLFSDELESLKYEAIHKIVEQEIKPMQDAGLPILWNG